MKAIKNTLSALLLLSLLFLTPVSAYAATFRSGDEVTIDQNEQSLSDLYAAGGQVWINTTINNDLVVAGGDVTVDGDITGGLLAAGGNLTIRSNTANSARIAGGDILIEGTIQRDLVVIGGSVTVASGAAINGDLIFTGGKLTLRAPVKGNVYANGGQITLGSTVDGNVDGNMGELTLGETAIINGNLRYTSAEKAKIANGAIVRGKQEFKEDKSREEAQKGIAAITTAGTIYKLIADIIFSFVVVWLLNRFARKVIENSITEPVKSIGLGLAFLIITPILSLFLLAIIWLGITMFALYFLILLVSIVFGKLLIGWWILNWWSERENKQYILDWKAAIVGPIALFLLALIPFIGWLVIALIYLFAVGGVTQELFAFVSAQKDRRNGLVHESRTLSTRKTKRKSN